MRTVAVLVSILFFAPALARAAAFGFPDRPLWLSSNTAHVGEKITMYAAVYNASETEMKGTVSFMADGIVFDTKDVSLPPGGSILATSNWTAVQGTHALSASFASGTQKESAEKITVTITAAPPPPPKEPTIVEKSLSDANDFVSNITTSVPVVNAVANAVIDTTEAARKAGADFLEPYARPKAASQPVMNRATTPTLTEQASGYATQGLQLAAAAALFAFDTRWLFYILVIVLLFLTIRTLKGWVNRPRF